MIERDLFAQHVRHALADLHSPARLEANPLSVALTSEREDDVTAAQALRQVIREAIEALRPEPDLPRDQPEWLGYHLLHERYVQRASQVATCERVGLSRATYYRRHQQLAEAVAGVLWQRYISQQQASDQQLPQNAEGAADRRALHEAVRLARQAEHSPLDLHALLQGVLEMIAPLAKARGITLDLQVPAPLPTLYADHSVFRQILLNVLTEGIALAASHSLQLAVMADEHEVCWQLGNLHADKVARGALEHSAGFELGRALLQVYGGRIWLDETVPSCPVLCFSVPSARPPLILIIDDDADTVSLYRRYLEIHGYALQAARSGADAWSLLGKMRPDAILLDVLMPKEDGWGILQRLQTMPETAGIPVIICSVLSQPQLALTLGAAQVLRKPVTADVLHQALQVLLCQEGNADPAPPIAPSDSELRGTTRSPRAFAR